MSRRRLALVSLCGLLSMGLWLFVATMARADFRVFSAGSDAGVASGIDCYNATCSRSGSLLTVTGGGGGQWTQVDGGLHYGGGAISVDGGGFFRSLTTSGSFRAGSTWLNGALAVDAGITAIGNLGVQGNGVFTGSLITGSPTWHNGSVAVDAGTFTVGDAIFASKIGIGTASPSYALESVGSVPRIATRTTGSTSYADFSCANSSGRGGVFGVTSTSYTPAAGVLADQVYLRSDSTVTNGINIATGGTTALTLGTNDTTRITVSGTGNTTGTGDLTWDTPTLLLTSSNNRVGIGVSPTVTLDVQNASSGSAMKVRSTSTSAFSTIVFANSADTTRMSLGHGNSATSSPFTSSNYLFISGADLKFVNGSSAVMGTITESTGALSWTGPAYVNNVLGVDAGVTVVGAINATGALAAASGAFTGALSGNGLTAGNSYINGSLGVDAGVTVAGNLNVVGTGAVTGNLSTDGNMTCGNASGDTLTITGTAVSVPNGIVITSAGSGIGVDVAAGGSGTIGIRGTGNSNSVGVRGVGGPSGAGCSCAAGSTSGQGLVATASSGSASAGVLATGGGSNGRGVDGAGGGTSGVGVFGTGASTSGTGVHGQGGGTGAGIRGIGGATGVGGLFNGGATSGIGVQGTGSNVSAGVRGVGGSGGGRGGEFVGSGNGDGLSVSVDTGSTGKAINMDATNGSGYAFYAIADQSSPVSAVGRFATQDTNPSVAVNGDIFVYSGNESFRFYTRGAWREFQVLGKDSTDNSGSPGATTIDKPNGRFAVAAAASSVVVTNSYVAAASIVMVTPMDLDTTCTLYKVVPAAGSFTLTTNAACTAATKFMFSVE